jgi:hypothetical protein
MGISNGRFIVLLDIDRVLSSNEILAATMAAQEEVVAADFVEAGGELPQVELQHA